MLHVTRLTDTHCHFEDERYDDDREQIIKTNLAELAFVVNVTADPDKLETVANFAKEYQKIYASLGVHPHYALKVTPHEVQDKIEKIYADISKIFGLKEKIVAIGECGLDYYFRNQDIAGRTEYEVREAQRELFEAQIDLAIKHNLALVVHTRDEQAGWDAYQDVLEILDGKTVKRVTIHSFSGDVKFAREFTDRGFYLGISGILTFDKTGRLPEAVKEVSLERLLLETDAPYLAPVPHRGKRNEPRFTKFIAQKIAEIKGITSDEVLQITEANARQLFGIVVK